MINTYERICVDDLRGMIRQENHILVLIRDHEVTEVLARIVTVPFANCQEVLVHIEWVRDADILYVLDPAIFTSSLTGGYIQVKNYRNKAPAFGHKTNFWCI